MPLFINPAAKHLRQEFQRPRATTPQDASLPEILDRIMDHGIFLELSTRIRLLSLSLNGGKERLVVETTEA